MATKKKFLKSILFVIFVSFFVLSKPCYARTRLTEDEAKYVWQYLMGDSFSAYINNFSYFNFVQPTVSASSRVSNNSYSNFMSFFNTNNTIDINLNSTVFFVKRDTATSDTYIFYCMNFNNGKVNDLPHMYLEFDTPNNIINLKAVDDNLNPVSYNWQCFAFSMTTTSSNFYNNWTGSADSVSSYLKFKYNFNSNWGLVPGSDTVMQNLPGLATFYSTNSAYFNYNGSSTLSNPTSFLIRSVYTPPTPIPTSTPIPTATPIPTGGGIDYTNQLNDINNSINNQGQAIITNQNENTDKIIENQNQNTETINNTLTQQPNLDNTTINSEDIEDSLGFDFMADPYSNFWYEITNGLRSSLTGSVRQLPINWLGYQGFFDLDNLGFNYPASVRLILVSSSTISLVWVLVKWWKIIVNKLTSGSMDEVLAMNEEERHC